MLPYNDLTVGEVVDFDDEPDKMCGHVKITSEDDPRLGAVIQFGYDDGVFLDSWGHRVSWGEKYYHPGFNPTDVIFSTDWDGGYISVEPQWRLKIPKVGDKLVFWVDDSDEVHKVDRWTYDAYYKQRALSVAPMYVIEFIAQRPAPAGFHYDGTVWEGWFLADPGLYLTKEGAVPNGPGTKPEWFHVSHVNCTGEGECFYPEQDPEDLLADILKAEWFNPL